MGTINLPPVDTPNASILPEKNGMRVLLCADSADSSPVVELILQPGQDSSFDNRRPTSTVIAVSGDDHNNFGGCPVGAICFSCAPQMYKDTMGISDGNICVWRPSADLELVLEYFNDLIAWPRDHCARGTRATAFRSRYDSTLRPAELPWIPRDPPSSMPEGDARLARLLHREGILQAYYIIKRRGISASAWMALKEHTRHVVIEALQEIIGNPITGQGKMMKRYHRSSCDCDNLREFAAIGQSMDCAVFQGIHAACRAGSINDALQLLPSSARREAWRAFRVLSYRLPLNVTGRIVLYAACTVAADDEEDREDKENEEDEEDEEVEEDEEEEEGSEE